MEESKFIKCAECEVEFEWTSGEQEFFKKKDFKPPKRCKPCRAMKREQMDRDRR